MRTGVRTAGGTPLPAHVEDARDVLVAEAAAAVFVAWASLDWSVVGLMAVGSVFGGWAGAHVGRRLPPVVFRILVVTSGYAVGVHLLAG